MPSNSQPDLTPIDSGLHGGSHELLGRGLGTFSIVLMVVAAAAPLTVVAATIPVMLSLTHSVSVPLFFLGAAVILILFSVGFTRMSKYVKNAGAFYSYIKVGMGRVIGTGAATLAFGSYFILLIALYGILGVLASNTVENFTGATLPWWLFTAMAWLASAFLGYRDIDLSAKVLGIALVLEGTIVLILDFAIIFHGGGNEGLSFTSFIPHDVSPATFGYGLMFAVFSFIGFEATAVFRHEAKNPDKTVPRATFIAVVLIGIFYAFSSWAIVVGAGGKLWNQIQTDPDNFVFDLASTYASPVLMYIMEVLVVTSIFACVLSFHNVLSRYAFTLGSYRILPHRLGVVHTKHHTPSFASLILSAASLAVLIVFVLARLDPYTVGYTWLSSAATLGLVALMALTSIAVMVFFRKNKSGNFWATFIAPGLALIGMVIVVYTVVSNFGMLIGNDTAAVVLVILLLVFYAVGVGISLYMRVRDRAAYARLSDAVEPSI